VSARAAALSPRAAALLAGLALFACRTAPLEKAPLASGDPRPAARVAALRALGEARHALRATGRVGFEGPEGSGFSDQLLLVERPANLRIEVIGLLQQRVLVLATDGARYQLYRAESPGLESGEVHPGVLDEVVGLPLTPDAAARLLLATPLAPDAEPEATHGDASGALSLAWPDQTLDFDAAGRLVALAFHPGGRDVLAARWGDWRDTASGAFPYRLELELHERGARWTVEYREVELEPALAPELFRLAPSTR
jgi:hypothetical protein